jgi:hypothetical protein
MMRLVAVCVMLLGFFHGAAQAQDSFADAFWQFKASSGFDFSSGTYGASKPTEILYIPATLQAAKGPWTFKAVVPWIRVSGPALLLDGTTDGTAGVRTSGAASGVGDINLSAMYSLESLYTYGLYVDLTARVKAPTASYAQGLGTGAWDETFQADVAKTWGDVMPFFSFGYRVTGQPKNFALRDVYYGSVGVQYTWSPLVTTGASYEVRSAAIAAAAAPQDSLVYANWHLSEAWSVNTYAVVGFSRTSPTAGGGAVVTYRWN